jgi:hypothetical protein
METTLATIFTATALSSIFLGNGTATNGAATRESRRSHGSAHNYEVAHKIVAVGEIILLLALFVIGCCAAAGHLNGIVTGGCAIGLTAPLLLSSLIRAVLAKKRCTPVVMTILAVALVIIGALAIAGVLLPHTVGWVMIAPALPAIALTSCLCCSTVIGVTCCLAALR